MRKIHLANRSTLSTLKRTKSMTKKIHRPTACTRRLIVFLLKLWRKFSSWRFSDAEDVKIYNANIFLELTKPLIDRPSHLQIPGGPKMARAALRRRAIFRSFAIMQRKSGESTVCCLADRRATYGR